MIILLIFTIILGIGYTVSNPPNIRPIEMVILIIYLFLAIVYATIGIVVGVLALKKLKLATTKKEMFSLSILCLILCNLVSGILLLCMEDKDFCEEEKEETHKKSIDTVEEKLLKLEKMKNDKLIDDEEYKKLRMKIIESEF